jgi:TolB-like protein/DNA-binding winged helix-turn-helix (wHTH) protein/Flp pilus assembly protein TadD
MQAPQPPLIREFGDFELDATRRLLTGRPDGRPVEITGRVLDALIYLVERPGQLIDKRALIEALWPNVVVEDGNLTQTIHALRRVLGEKAGEHRYIATVPGRGYQWVAPVSTRSVAATPPVAQPVAPVAPAPAAAPHPPVTPAPAAPASTPARRASDFAAPSRPASRKWPLGILALVLVAIATGAGIAILFALRGHDAPTQAVAEAHPSIAVLPFVDMSDEQDQAHFADGLSEEILNILARADHLRVTARTSSFSFRGENADIETIAHRLDVAYVLEGSVRKAGNRLRITAQLIDASNSAHVWSDTYDRDIHDVFGLQREIATAVAGALRVTLAREQPRRAETASAEAYEHYLQGRFLFHRRAPDDLLQAKAHFDDAVRIDPSYARAWAGLAGVYFVARYEKLDLPDAMNNWRQAIERATTLDPQLAEGHMRAAQYYWQTRQQPAADAELARAAALDPQDPLVLGATMSEYIEKGRLADAVEMQQRIVAIDPLSASNRGNLGAFLIATDRLPEAQVALERALELSPAAPPMLTTVADLLIRQNRIDDALGVIARLPEGYLRDERRAIVHFAKGEAREGDEIVQRLAALTKQRDFDPGVALSLAEIYATRNDADHAFEWLNRAISRSDRQKKMKPCWALLEDMQISAYFKPLRSDPRWESVLTTLRACLY